MPHALIVDDKEENLYYLSALLQGNGYTVETASHGAEALVKARQRLPELIVSDLLMPVMDGYTLLRHWKVDTLLKTIPFIVYTATYTEPEDEQLALDLGADAFILKPCEPDTFMARIHEVEARSDAQQSNTHAPYGDENAMLKYYSQTLIRKLEEKTLQLEDANRGLQQDIVERKRVEESLRLYGSAVEQSKESIMITDARLDENGPHIVFVNPAFTTMTGYSASEVIGQSPCLLYGTRTDAAVLDRMRHRLAAGVEFEGEAIHYRKDGSAYFQHSHITPLRDVYGAITHFVAIQRDVTERKETEARIIYLNRVYAMLSSINALIVRVNEHAQLYNEACRIAVENGGFRMAMVCMSDVVTQRIRLVASAGKSDALLGKINAVLCSPSADSTMLVRVVREHRTVVCNDTSTDPAVIFSDDYVLAGVKSIAVLPLIVGDAVVGAIALYAGEVEFFHGEELQLLSELADDIAFAIDHIDKYERLNYLAYYDDLTGLANRTLFLERVGQFIRSAQRGGHKLGLLLLDIERFKNINDSMGRAVGDALLKQAGAWLPTVFGETSLLARVDADRFGIVLPVLHDSSEVARLIEQTLAAFLEHPFGLNGEDYRVGAKIGIALYPDDGGDAESLFKNAEAALKQAKKGGDRYLFHARQMTEAVAAKVTLEKQLRQAIDRNELILHYQPKIGLASGKLTGVEALIRWNDPRTGLVPPGHFIPVLEETGLIYEVGRWALRQSIEDYLRWRAAGLAAVRIAVNVSALQLRNPGFVAEIERNLAIDAAAAAGIELEITESMIMEDMARSVSCLSAIRDMGLTIAIDDFGTGFSSLSYLAKLPVDALKIDRAFINDLTTGPQGLGLVTAIINLAHTLKLKVVAEGVETEAQSRLLHELSCDEIQGFLICKPVPTEVLESRYLGRGTF
jgi:diguanylate cyclase (GGDEF)-like protein/PAS domain S-box-containing protein